MNPLESPLSGVTGCRSGSVHTSVQTSVSKEAVRSRLKAPSVAFECQTPFAKYV